MASAAQELIAELDASLAKRSNEERSSMLRQVCELFLTHAPACAAEQVSVFDNVMIRLMAAQPREALVELSGKLATVDNAPSNVTRRLASDSDMTIAGPILTRSNALTDKDLAAIVAEKGASHLKAIIERNRIGEAVTDVLLDQKDRRELLCKLAGNDEVRFSEVGIVKLVYAAKNDKALAEIVLRRKDLPPEMLPFLQMVG
jgi:uncharacterized protein (DUF2336 family)